MKLPRDWRDLIESLSSHRVRFLVVGAHALAVHGRPRATGDLDVLVEPTRENAGRLGAALTSFGFPALGARGRTRVRIGRRLVGFLGKKQFLKDKASAGRPRDLLDLALLEEAGVLESRPRRRTPRR